jgi:ectoine hydroxylase-related dioxygenase (phytanoyl-CoA dioxygenase family)
LGFPGSRVRNKHMTTLVENLSLTSVGRKLDTSEAAFGELRDSSPLLRDAEALRERMEEDGYLYVPGFFRREDVFAARSVMVQRLAQQDLLRPGTDPMEAIIREGAETAFRPDLTEENAPLQKLLYHGRIIEFYRDLFGEPVRHYDFTWLRAMSPGKGTQPHCDIVYMGRGTREKLRTAWVPLGDVSFQLGGLMILEGSSRKHERLRAYLERDVDTYCANGRHAAEIESGAKSWEWNGSLSRDPASLREKLGGRWLTAEFRAGDLLTFSMHTVHASLDNATPDRIRFSSDSRYQPVSLPADERWIGEKPVGHGLAGKRGRIC